jgi:glutathione S-transferase
MTLKLYAFLASGPCRMAAMTLEFVGKDFDYKTVDLFKGEQNNPEYLKVFSFLNVQ